LLTDNVTGQVFGRGLVVIQGVLRQTIEAKGR
jgi:hypothetical protein